MSSLRTLRFPLLATALLGAVTVAASAPQADAQLSTRYVSTSGSDAASGTSSSPWRTLQHAASAAADGTQVVIAAGTYSGFTVDRPGLTFQPATGAKVIVKDTTGRRNVVEVRAGRTTIRRLTVTGGKLQFGAGVRVEAGAGPVLIAGNRLVYNRSFGIKIKNSQNVTVRDNVIGKNETGVEVSGDVRGTRITHNWVHHNDRMVTSSRGGNGFVFHHAHGARADRNMIWGNRAPHLDGSGWDGGAFEIYGSSDLVMDGNWMKDNNNVMETGTDGAPCDNLRFVRNVAWNAGTVKGETQGLILRCASNSLFAHNVLDGLDTFGFDFNAAATEYGGSIAGLRVQNNVIANGRAYSVDSALPASVVVDHNLSYTTSAATADRGTQVAYVKGFGNTESLAEFRAWTGLESNGFRASPGFRNAAAHDYRPRADSPMVDRGIRLSAAFSGSAPDVGRFEFAD